MVLKLCIGLLVIWETVYLISYGKAVFKSGNKAGGAFSFLITLLVVVSYLIFLSENIIF